MQNDLSYLFVMNDWTGRNIIIISGHIRELIPFLEVDYLIFPVVLRKSRYFSVCITTISEPANLIWKYFFINLRKGVSRYWWKSSIYQ
jgi:hypothetical protein